MNKSHFLLGTNYYQETMQDPPEYSLLLKKSRPPISSRHYISIFWPWSHGYRRAALRATQKNQLGACTCSTTQSLLPGCMGGSTPGVFLQPYKQPEEQSGITLPQKTSKKEVLFGAVFPQFGPIREQPQATRQVCPFGQASSNQPEAAPKLVQRDHWIICGPLWHNVSANHCADSKRTGLRSVAQVSWLPKLSQPKLSPPKKNIAANYAIRNLWCMYPMGSHTTDQAQSPTTTKGIILPKSPSGAQEITKVTPNHTIAQQ